jgi:hypothetical protein
MFQESAATADAGNAPKRGKSLIFAAGAHAADKLKALFVHRVAFSWFALQH